MSHELRTPLNSVLGFAQLLDLDGELTDRQRDSVEHILKGGRHLLRLIDEVLDISRVEAGELALSVEAVGVADVMRDCEDLIGPLAERSGVRIDARAADTATQHVFADRQRLQQVLLNLLANAVKYNHPGGSVTIGCEPTLDERLRITVRDTGPGLTEEQQARIFVPFERLGAETGDVEGSGIGLALSLGLARVMGGELGLSSAVGVGSTFWVELPVVAAPPYPVEQVRSVTDATLAAASALSPVTVLYIEDNLSNLRLVERLIADRPGATLLTTMQGGLGLALAREHAPDLVLLDLHLPDMPGAEVLRSLRGDLRTRRIPVVIISADATPGQVERLREAGADAYLTKPLDVLELITILDGVATKPEVVS
jgi:CheY-like chemotaxis protein